MTKPDADPAAAASTVDTHVASGSYPTMPAGCSQPRQGTGAVSPTPQSPHAEAHSPLRTPNSLLTPRDTQMPLCITPSAPLVAATSAGRPSRAAPSRARWHRDCPALGRSRRAASLAVAGSAPRLRAAGAAGTCSPGHGAHGRSGTRRSPQRGSVRLHSARGRGETCEPALSATPAPSDASRLSLHTPRDVTTPWAARSDVESPFP